MANAWQPELTDDGSYTFFSPSFGETFHSRLGAKSEAMEKFVRATDLPEKARNAESLVLLDVCYGLGYNTAAALDTIWQVNPRCRVEVWGLELDLTVPQGTIAPHSPDHQHPIVLRSWSEPVIQVLTTLAEDQRGSNHTHPHPWQGELHIGDARHTLPRLLDQQNLQADAIFLDPFSPRRCPQLWSGEFLGLVARCLAPEGKLATYCRAAAVRSALQEAGLQLGSLPLPKHQTPLKSHEWADGTVAALPNSQAALSLPPLSTAEQEHLQTRAGIVYRDPTLRDTAETILHRRSQEQNQSPRESTSQWRKRWGII